MGARVLIAHWHLGCVERNEGLGGCRGAGAARVDDSSSSCLLCEVAFDCELVTCSCYLLLLFGLTQSPSPPHKRWKGGRRGEPIIGQPALIVWFNSWLIELDMCACVCVCVCDRQGKKTWQGGIKPWPCATLVEGSLCRIRPFSAQRGERAAVLRGTQLITVSTSLWGSKYTGINTTSSETFIYCITATEIFIWPKVGASQCGLSSTFFYLVKEYVVRFKHSCCTLLFFCLTYFLTHSKLRKRQIFVFFFFT